MRGFMIFALLTAAPLLLSAGDIWKSKIGLAEINKPVPGFSSSLTRSGDIDGCACVTVSGRCALLNIQSYIGAERLGDFTLDFRVRLESEKSAFQVQLAKKRRDPKDGFSHYELSFTCDTLTVREVPSEGVKTPSKSAEFAFVLKPGTWERVSVNVLNGFIYVSHGPQIKKANIKYPILDSGSFDIINALGSNSYSDILVFETAPNIPATLKKVPSK